MHIEIFKDDNQGYLQWLQQHPNGYVLNTYRSIDPAYMILHRAICHAISGTPARGEHWTVGYQKICAQRIDELINWAQEEYGQPPRQHDCQPR
jgi:hypothetical protein